MHLEGTIKGIGHKQLINAAHQRQRLFALVLRLKIGGRNGLSIKSYTDLSGWNAIYEYPQFVKPIGRP